MLRGSSMGSYTYSASRRQPWLPQTQHRCSSPDGSSNQVPGHLRHSNIPSKWVHCLHTPLVEDTYRQSLQAAAEAGWDRRGWKAWLPWRAFSKAVESSWVWSLTEKCPSQNSWHGKATAKAQQHLRWKYWYQLQRFHTVRSLTNAQDKKRLATVLSGWHWCTRHCKGAIREGRTSFTSSSTFHPQILLRLF